jgi:hypothetical protein
VHLLKPIFEIEREQALGFAARRGFGLFAVQGGRDAGPFGSHIPFKIDTSKPVPIAHFHVTVGNGLAAIPDGAAGRRAFTRTAAEAPNRFFCPWRVIRRSSVLAGLVARLGCIRSVSGT